MFPWANRALLGKASACEMKLLRWYSSSGVRVELELELGNPNSRVDWLGLENFYSSKISTQSCRTQLWTRFKGSKEAQKSLFHKLEEHFSHDYCGIKDNIMAEEVKPSVKPKQPPKRLGFRQTFNFCSIASRLRPTFLKTRRRMRSARIRRERYLFCEDSCCFVRD